MSKDEPVLSSWQEHVYRSLALGGPKASTYTRKYGCYSASVFQRRGDIGTRLWRGRVVWRCPCCDSLRLVGDPPCITGSLPFVQTAASMRMIQAHKEGEIGYEPDPDEFC